VSESPRANFIIRSKPLSIYGEVPVNSLALMLWEYLLLKATFKCYSILLFQTSIYGSVGRYGAGITQSKLISHRQSYDPMLDNSGLGAVLGLTYGYFVWKVVALCGHLYYLISNLL